MPDQRPKSTSKYTADRMIPGAFEGETITRRRFMTTTTHAAGGIASAAFLLPALGFAFAPIFKEFPHHWESVGTVDQFLDYTYIPVVFTLIPGIGEVGETTAYVRKFNPAIDTDKYDQDTDPQDTNTYSPFIAISTRCAHLGCPVRWVDAAERFICPCHGGVYDLLGRRVGGPPVRPLDRFFTRTVPNPAGGPDLLQIGPRYSVNSLLRRFSPRDPGEPLDGIGQYLYPSRPSDRI